MVLLKPYYKPHVTAQVRTSAL